MPTPTLCLLRYNPLPFTGRTALVSLQLALDQTDDSTKWISGTTCLRPLALSCVQADANISIAFAVVGIVQWMSNSLHQHKCTDYKQVTSSTLHNIDTKHKMHNNNTQTLPTNWLINSTAHRTWYRFMSCSLEVCLLQSIYSDDPRDEPTATNTILGSCTIAHRVSKNDKDD